MRNNVHLYIGLNPAKIIYFRFRIFVIILILVVLTTEYD